MNEGFAVVGIDALKIEPLPAMLTGSINAPPQPVHAFESLYEDLDTRTGNGFGGVAEYGITVRWDKNFLKVIYLTLLRQRTFRVYGGVRFGGSLTLDDAWSLDFDHVALATGAGKPSIIGLKNNLIRGIRKASDFLMGLQLTGAAKESSLTNLQVRLPAGVIGGGLTAIDTATEVMAYYPRQVEKVLHRYERLVADVGADTVHARYDAEELAILDEALNHGRAIRDERKRAAENGEQPDFASLVKGWGGATLFYRKRLEESPAYRQNHEEVNKALEEGIEIATELNPLEAIADEHGALSSVRFEHTGEHADEPDLELPLKSLYVAAGTSPNIIYEQEHPGSFELDGKFFRRFERVTAGLEPIDARCNDDAQAGERVAVHLVRKRWPLCQFLWRQPPGVRRQRGQGHGEREGRLPLYRRSFCRRTGRARSGTASAARSRLATFSANARRRVNRNGRGGQPSHPHHHRSHRPRTDGGEQFRTRPILPGAESRRICTAHRRHRARA